MNRVTLQDVADHLHVSPSTVSRGLHGLGKIPAATRERIREACARLGYRPDALLSELASARWQRDRISQGCVLGYVDCSLPSDPPLNMALFARAQAVALGYSLDVFERSAFTSCAKLQTTLRNRGITNVLLGPIFSKSMAIELDWSKFITVQLLPGFFSLPLHAVVQDHFNGVVLAWQKAVDHGYSRIGITLLDHPFRLMDDILRQSAVDACQKYLFPDLPIIPPFHYPPTDLKQKAFAKWIEMQSPDVVIGFNSTHYKYCRTKSGKEISYACLHGANAAGLSGIMDATISFGKEGINLLHFCRRTHQWGLPEERIDHVIEPKWFEGGSMPKKS